MRLVLVCCANERRLELGSDERLAVAATDEIWHDHEPAGGDIVCTGPFALFSAAPQVVVRATTPSVAPAIARTPEECVCPPGVMHLADCDRVRVAMGTAK